MCLGETSDFAFSYGKHIETERCGNVLIFLAVSAFDDALRSPETTGKEEPWP